MATEPLAALELKMKAAHLRGQWQVDPNRPQNLTRAEDGSISVQPVPGGQTHVWRWSDIAPLLDEACYAMPDSHTARRALILSNPGLPRGTTHTLLASLQIVQPGEIAWAHRHVINALRFSIQGSEQVFTVVDGRRLAMEPYDLVLTPGWTWHDHHNESAARAVWLDALDVPVTLALNQQFYEELGRASQEPTSGDLQPSLFANAGRAPDKQRPYRYPWRDMRRRVDALDEFDPWFGARVNYVDPTSGGPILPTISAFVQVLPPGFVGAFHRSTESQIAFVIEGEGEVDFDGSALSWRAMDSLSLPNWQRRRFVNRSSRERAVLFVLSDRPILDALGFLRTENE